MNSIPSECWQIIREYTNDAPIIRMLQADLNTSLSNFEFIVDDNIRLEEENRLLNERVLVLERLQLMLQRQCSRQQRKIRVLRNRVDVMESTQKRRRVGDILNRSLDYSSAADDSDVEIIELSDTE